MDKRKTLVLLRNGSMHRSVSRSDTPGVGLIRQDNKGTINPDDVLCIIPKPAYKCFLAATIIQFFIILAGGISFGIYYTDILKDVSDPKSDNIEWKKTHSMLVNDEARTMSKIRLKGKLKYDGYISWHHSKSMISFTKY